MLKPQRPDAEQKATTSPRATSLLESEDADQDRVQQPLRQRERSPHPYLYHTEELRALRNADASPPADGNSYDDYTALATDASFPPANQSTSSIRSPTLCATSSCSPTPDLNGSAGPKAPYTDHDGRARRRPAYRTSTTTTQGGSESGTEADDEASTLVKALPAPALRPRKGLRGASSEDVGAGLEELDALLTPAYLERKVGKREEGYFDRVLMGARAGGKEVKRRGKKSEGKEGVERLDKEEVERKWGEFKKKRRAEMARRVSETVLLAAIGMAVMNGRDVWSKAWGWHRGWFPSLM